VRAFLVLLLILWSSTATASELDLRTDDEFIYQVTESTEIFRFISTFRARDPNNHLHFDWQVIIADEKAPAIELVTTTEGALVRTARSAIQPNMGNRFSRTLGETWTTHYTIHRSDGIETGEMEYTVSDVKVCVVAAGTFLAVRVDSVRTNGARATTWYDVHSGMVIYFISGERQMELLKAPDRFLAIRKPI